MNLKSKVIAGAGSVAGVLAMAAPAFAVGTADTAVVSTFTSISDNVVATMGAVAPFGIAILAIFLGFRYGKRIFTQLSK